MSPSKRDIGDPLEQVARTGKIGSKAQSGDRPESTQTDLPTNPQVVLSTSGLSSETTSPQVVLSTSGLNCETTKPLVDKTTNQETGKTTSRFVGKTEKPLIEKYTTHLRPDTIRAIKLYAVTHDLKDYEVMQMLCDLAFEQLELIKER